MLGLDLLRDDDRPWMALMSAHAPAFELDEVWPAAPSHVPVLHVPFARAGNRHYTLPVDPVSSAAWSGQVHRVSLPTRDVGYSEAVGVGLHGFLLAHYFEERLGEEAAALIERTVGVAVPREGINLAAKREARRAHGVTTPTTVTCHRLDPIDEATLAEILRLAPHDGEVWRSLLSRETKAGRPEAALAALRRLEPTWRHTWGPGGFALVREQVRALDLPDDGTSQLVFEARHSDFGERFDRAIALVRAEDWYAGTKWVHDLAYEEGDFHSVLPLLARGFHKLGWRWAVDLCLARRPTDAEKARWPFDLDEALR